MLLSTFLLLLFRVDSWTYKCYAVTFLIIMLTDILPDVFKFNAVGLSAFMLSVIMLSVIMLSVIMLSVIMLSVIELSVFMLSVIMLSVIMLSVVTLSVIIPIAIAPIQPTLIFLGMASALPLSLPTNIRLGCNYLCRTTLSSLVV
jgi:hypothetical protein